MDSALHRHCRSARKEAAAVMVNAILPLLRLGAAAGLWKIGLQKIPLLLVLAAVVATFSAFGVERPELAAAVVPGLVFIGMLVFILYAKFRLWVDREKIEEGRKRLDQIGSRRSNSQA